MNSEGNTKPQTEQVQMELPKLNELSSHSQPFGEATVDLSDKSVLMQAVMQQLLENNNIVLIDKRQSSKKPVNPGPLGLLGFAMTTILLNIHNADFFGLGAVIPAMGLVMGGGLQLIAGLLEYFNGNAFPATAFMCYGSFWLSLVGVWLLPQGASQPHVITATKSFVACYLLLWGLFTGCMTVVTYFKSHRLMQFLFTTLTLLFFLLTLGNFMENTTVLKVAGWVGIVCGSSALYIAFAEILQDNLGFPVLPLFPVKRD